MNTKHEAYAAGSVLAVGFGAAGEAGHTIFAMAGLVSLVASALMYGFLSCSHQNRRHNP